MQNEQKLSDEQYNKVLFLNALWEYISQWQGIFSSIRDANPEKLGENIKAAAETLNEISKASNGLKVQINDGTATIANDDQTKLNTLNNAIQKIESENGSVEQFARNIRDSISKALPEQSISRGGVNLGNAQETITQIDEQLENKLPLGDTLRQVFNNDAVHFNTPIAEFQNIPLNQTSPLQPPSSSSATNLTADNLFDSLSSNQFLEGSKQSAPPQGSVASVGKIPINDPFRITPPVENALDRAKDEVNRLENQINGILASGGEPDQGLLLEIGLAKNTVTIIEKSEKQISYEEAKSIANQQWAEFISQNGNSVNNDILQQTEPVRTFLDAMEEQAKLIRNANPNWTEEQVQAQVKANWDDFEKKITDPNAGSALSPEAAAAQADGLAIDYPLQQADAEIARLQRQLEAAAINGSELSGIQLDIALVNNARAAIEESIAKGNPISYDEARSKAQSDWEEHLRLNGQDQNNPTGSQPPLEVLIENTVAQNSLPAPNVAYAYTKLEEVKAELASYDAVGQLAPAELEQRRQIYESAYNDVVADPSRNFDQIVQGVYDYLGSLGNNTQNPEPTAPLPISNPTPWYTTPAPEEPAPQTDPAIQNANQENSQQQDYTNLAASGNDAIYWQIDQQAGFLSANARAIWDNNQWMTPSQAAAQAAVDFSFMLKQQNPGDPTAEVNHNLDVQAKQTVNNNPAVDWGTARNEAQANFDNFVNMQSGGGTPDPSADVALPVTPVAPPEEPVPWG